MAASTEIFQGETQRLVALMPVEDELEAEALNAWRQLVHVLTHEIMNSLTPVASLSRTAHDLLADLRADLPADVADDLSTALDAISRRATSLKNLSAVIVACPICPLPAPKLLRCMRCLTGWRCCRVRPDKAAMGGRSLASNRPRCRWWPTLISWSRRSFVDLKM